MSGDVSRETSQTCTPPGLHGEQFDRFDQWTGLGSRILRCGTRGVGVGGDTGASRLSKHSDVSRETPSTLRNSQRNRRPPLSRPICIVEGLAPTDGDRLGSASLSAREGILRVRAIMTTTDPTAQRQHVPARKRNSWPRSFASFAHQASPRAGVVRIDVWRPFPGVQRNSEARHRSP